jgi:Granulin
MKIYSVIYVKQAVCCHNRLSCCPSGWKCSPDGSECYTSLASVANVSQAKLLTAAANRRQELH